MRLPVNQVLPLILIAALAACGGTGLRTAKAPPAPANGPAADYPVVVGPPFQIGNFTYTPEDRLNYDAVGFAQSGSEGGTYVSAAHKTLPLPSYVEVTSLDSGRTILVRVERRGPMSNERLIELSPGAAAQLGIAGTARPAVRVRRVNPPEMERAMLRAGKRAPDRMDTPKGLLSALSRRLDAGATTLTAQSPAPPSPSAKTPARAPRSSVAPASTSPAATPAAPAASPASKPAPAARLPEQRGLVVQVAAFSTEPRAASVAGNLGGQVSQGGRYWRVRLGPYGERSDAEAALAKAKAAGYSDARIQRAD